MLRKFYISLQSSIPIMRSNMLIATVDDKRERKEPVLQGEDSADNTQ